MQYELTRVMSAYAKTVKVQDRTNSTMEGEDWKHSPTSSHGMIGNC